LWWVFKGGREKRKKKARGDVGKEKGCGGKAGAKPPGSGGTGGSAEGAME